MSAARPGTRRFAEREFDMLIRRTAPDKSAYAWQEISSGLRVRCEGPLEGGPSCSHRGRAWRGHRLGTTTPPLCVACAIRAERITSGLPPVWLAKEEP